MSYINRTRRSIASGYEVTVCITKDECKVLLPFIEKEHRDIKAKYDKYNDIHNDGVATERDENLRMKYLERYECLNSLLIDIKELNSKLYRQ